MIKKEVNKKLMEILAILKQIKRKKMMMMIIMTKINISFNLLTPIMIISMIWLNLADFSFIFNNICHKYHQFLLIFVINIIIILLNYLSILLNIIILINFIIIFINIINIFINIINIFINFA